MTESEKRAYYSALSYIEAKKPFLAITHGLSGSGKSTCAMMIAQSRGAIRIRSDVERIRIFPDEKQRVAKRAAEKSDISEADTTVLQIQIQRETEENLTEQEKEYSVAFDCSSMESMLTSMNSFSPYS